MRRYRIASWALLILSVFNFTLAAPVAAQDIHGVHVNVVDAANDRIAALQKRMQQVYQNGWAEHESSDDSSAGEVSQNGGELSDGSSAGAGEVIQDGGVNHEPQVNQNAGVNHEPQVNQNGGVNHEPQVYQNGGVNHEPSDGSSAGQVYQNGNREPPYQNGGGAEWDDSSAGEVVDPLPDDSSAGEGYHRGTVWDDSSAGEGPSEIGPATASGHPGQSPPPDHEQSPPPGQEHDEGLPSSPEAQHPAAPESEGFWSKLWKGAWQTITRLPCFGCRL